MIKKLLAPLVAIVLAAAAPEAVAQTPADYGCRILNATATEATGEGVFDGIVGGYAVTGDTQNLSMRCYVEVNGTEVASTSTMSGTGAAAVADRVTYNMNEGDVVRLCIEVAWGSDYFRECEETFLVQAPQEFVDALFAVAGVTNTACASAGLDACSTGICGVNTGACNGGICVVNTGTCEPGAICGVNTGTCYGGGICGVNTNTCGQPPRVDPGGVGRPLGLGG